MNIEMSIMWRMCPQSSALNRLEDQLAKMEGQLTPLTNRGVGRETWWWPGSLAESQPDLRSNYPKTTPPTLPGSQTSSP